MLRIISANLNGIRSAAKKGFIPWALQQKADFICMQELKAQEPDLDEAMMRPGGLLGFFHCAEKKGYSGCGIYTPHQPDDIIYGFGNPEFDAEGRYVEARYKTLSVISVYMPSGSSSPERQEAKFRYLEAFMPHLIALKRSGREIVLCGDVNIAHHEVGFKELERQSQEFRIFTRGARLVNAPLWRNWIRRRLSQLEPDTTDACYTWWSQRGQAYAKNVGWRIDYQIATAKIAASAKTTSIYKQERFSDHAPLVVDYDWSI
jgi:exodeoxyribonuclease III